MIDTSTWKEFNMYDIGFKNFHGIRQKQSDRTEGNTPLLTAGKENQGVASYIGNPPSTYIDSITVDMFGNSFFHKGVYAGDDNIYFFVNDNVSDEAKLFIAAIINTDNTPKYAFKDQFRQPQADALSVHLPATSDGQPDWDYMESYMKTVMEESEKSLENLKKADDAKKHLIDRNTWKEFRVGDYFHGVRGTSRKMQALNDGSTPVIAAARYNQGIAGYYDVPSEYENAITISCNGVGCGSTYYHDYPFAITGDAIVLENIGNVPIGALHFIASVYDVYFSRKYSYTDKCSADKAEAECIALPATSTGEPDWQYMEDYMKNIMDKSEQIISDLQIGV